VSGIGGPGFSCGVGGASLDSFVQSEELENLTLSPSVLIGENIIGGGANRVAIVGDAGGTCSSNNVAIGGAARAVGSSATAIGAVSQATPESTCVGNSARVLGNAAAGTCVGFQAQIGLTDVGAANDGNICVGTRAQIPDDDTDNAIVIGVDTRAKTGSGQIAIGRSVHADHDGAVLLGGDAASDAAHKFRLRLNSVYALQAIANPASGETGLFLVADVGGGVVVKQVTLAASVGGKRALQVDG
jgi:hypothetical protein